MTIATNPYTGGGTLAGFGAPAANALTIAPHDTNELANYVRGIYVGGAGNVVVVTANGDEVTFVGVQAGSVLPVVAKQVKNTSTTATSMVGLY